MDPLIQALMQSNGLDDEEQQLEVMRQRSLKSQQPRQQGESYGAVAGGLNGLASVLQALHGVIDERKYEGRAKDLAARRQHAQQGIMGQVSHAMQPRPPLQNPVMGPPTGAEAAAGAGPGIPIQQGMDPQALQRLSVSLQMGGPRYAQLGQHIGSMAQHQEDAGRQEALAKLTALGKSRETQEARDFQRQQMEDQQRFHAGESALSRAAALRLAGVNNAADVAKAQAAHAQGKLLPSKETQDVGGIDAAGLMLDDLMQTRAQKAHPVSVFGVPVVPAGLAAKLPGTNAVQYNDAQKAAAQTVGLILEGGKLAESDLGRYMDLMPTAGDGEERAKAKVANVKQMLAKKKAAQLGAFQGAGYNIGTLGGAAPSAGAGGVDAVPAPSATVRIRTPDGKTGTIPRAALAEAIKDGASEVP